MLIIIVYPQTSVLYIFMLLMLPKFFSHSIPATCEKQDILWTNDIDMALAPDQLIKTLLQC